MADCGKSWQTMPHGAGNYLCYLGENLGKTQCQISDIKCDPQASDPPPPLPKGACHFTYDDSPEVTGNTWCAKSKNWCKLNTLKNLAPQDSDLSFCGLINRAQTCSQWGSPDVAGGGYVQAGDIACVVDTNYAKCSIDCSHVVKPASL